MVKKMTISFLALLAGSAAAFDFLQERRLDAHGHAAIAGYAPGSDVVQHNMLDLDQADLEAYLKEAPVNFAAAKKIYNEGGHSGGYFALHNYWEELLICSKAIFRALPYFAIRPRIFRPLPYFCLEAIFRPSSELSCALLSSPELF